MSYGVCMSATHTRRRLRSVLALALGTLSLAAACAPLPDSPAADQSSSTTSVIESIATLPQTPQSSAQSEASLPPAPMPEHPAPPEADQDAPANPADAVSGHIRQLLATVPVKGRAPKTGYSRDAFGQRWSDDVSAPLGHNGCDTRNDILNRDLTEVTYRPRTRDCVVVTGTLHDPYTGSVIYFQRGQDTSTAVQIDHVVALSDAWQKGAQLLSPQLRQEFANDPLNLLAVDGPANQQKSDSDAASWLPPQRSFRCQFVARQVGVKYKYQLWVTPAEHEAISRWLDTCNPADAAALEAIAAEASTPMPY